MDDVISGAYVFTRERSARSYQLNKMANTLSYFGTKNEAWDNEFMDQLETEPAPLAELSTQDYMERGGTEGVEMIMWLAMRGALGKNVKRVHRNYTAPLTTGYGLLLLVLET